MENYLKTIQDLVAKPIKEMAETGIEGDRKYGAKRALLIEALEVLKTEHKIDLKGSAFVSPFDNGGVKLKKVQTSTSSPEQYTMLKHCFLMGLPKTEYASTQVDLVAFQKELGLTNKEKDKRLVAIANKKTQLHDKYAVVADRKDKALKKVGTEIGKFSKSLTIEQEKANKAPPTPKKPFEKVVTSSTTLFKNVEEYKGLVGNKKEVWMEDYRKLMARLGVVIK
mgnify:CR=1 FL=1